MSVTIDDYCDAHTSQPEGVLNDIYRSIALHTANPHMSSSPYQGVLLEMLVSLKQPRIAVELGSYAGYGSVCMARGLAPDGMLHVVEANEECEYLIRQHLDMAGMSARVSIHIGQALEVIPQLPDGIEVAFVDADKVNYQQYYDMLLPKMASGGLLILDNMLWYGRVLESPETQLRCDRSTRVIQQLNDYITNDTRVSNILLPLRDGVMVCMVR